MNVKSAFGKNLKFYRKKKRLSQGQLSEKIDISVKHLSALERGLTFVSAELLEKLSTSLEIPAYCFFLKDRELFYSNTLDTIDRIIERHLIKTMEELKSELRQNIFKGQEL